MAVLVIGVSGLVGDADGEIRDECSDGVEHGVRRFGENAEAARAETYDDLSRGDGECGEDGVSGHGALFGAHRFGGVEGRSSRHLGIIAGVKEMRQAIQGRCSEIGTVGTENTYRRDRGELPQSARSGAFRISGSFSRGVIMISTRFTGRWISLVNFLGRTAAPREILPST